MPAVERCSADIVVLADADCFTDGLEDAIAAVAGGAGWGIPHRTVHRLHEKGTAAVLAGKPWNRQPLAQKAYRGIEGGGYVVAKRDTLLEIPLDPRFVGWGQEDEAHAIALRCLRGPPWRGDAPLVHLWHPPQQRLSRTRGSREGWNLRRRYLRARQSPDQMRFLLEEARDALHAYQPAVHAADFHR